MLDRKGQLLIGIAGALVLALIIFTIFMARSVKEGGVKEYVGEKQVKMLKLYHESHIESLYLTQKAKFALHKTILDFAESGGVKEECRRDGIPLWEESRNCYPKNLEDDFKWYFSKNFQHPNAYEYTVFGALEIVGTSQKPIEKNLVCASEICGKFVYKPDFHVNADYNLNIYDTKLVPFAKEIEKCSDLNCINPIIKKFHEDNPSYEMNTGECDKPRLDLPEDKFLQFCVVDKTNSYMSSEGFTNPKIRFILKLS